MGMEGLEHAGGSRAVTLPPIRQIRSPQRNWGRSRHLNLRSGQDDFCISINIDFYNKRYFYCGYSLN